jgi:type I restriction enzyme S subunit
MAGAGGQQRVPVEFLAESMVPVPPLDEQKKRVDLRSRAENIVRMRREAEQKAKEIIPALFLNMFGDPTTNPRGGKQAGRESREGRRGPERTLSSDPAGSLSLVAEPLGSLSEVVSGVAKGRNLRGKTTRQVPYLRVANVQADHLDLHEIKEISATEAEISELRLCLGDVLLTEGGDHDKLGRGSLLEHDLGECIHQNHVFRVRVDRHRLTPEYFLRAAKKTTNLASINMTQLRALSVMVPPLGAQRTFVARFQAVRELQVGLKRATVVASNAFDSLLAGVFWNE